MSESKESTLTIQEKDFDLKIIFNLFLQYKWSILFITLISFFIALYSLYFKPSIYNSMAIIEVKSDGKSGITKDTGVLGSAFSNFGSEKIAKQIEILKTFHTNNNALNKVNFKIQYYIYSRFRKIELYDNLPIQVDELNITNQRIINQLIKLTPTKNGFTLEVQNPWKTKLMHTLFNKPIIDFDQQKVFQFNKTIKTKYGQMTIRNDNKLKESIYFVLKGSNRQIYEGVVKSRLKIKQINPDASLIEIAYEDNIPQRANTYVNAVVESFIEQSVEEKSRQSNRIIDFINQQLMDMKKKLDRSEEKLEKYRIEHQAINPTLQADTYIKELSKIEIELSKNELKKDLLDNLLLYIKKRINLDAIAPSLMELGDSATIKLITKLQDLQIKEEGLKIQYSGKHPGLIAVRKQIQFIVKKIELNVQNFKSSMLHRNNSLKKLKKRYEENLKDMPTQERTLINLKRDYQVSSKTYNYLLSKKSEHEMIKVAILSDYRIIDKAYSNGAPIKPKRKFLMLLSIAVGLILGILQVILRNYFNDKIQSKEDIENLTTLPIYGLIPELKQKNIKIEVYKDPKAPFAESYRSLRTNLQFSYKGKEANIILISSTIMGEGKTTTAANLATIFQMANYKTVLLNLDMRKPTLHHYFDVDNTYGMSTYLSSKNTISEIIKSTQYDNLDIITSGPIPPNPSELLLSNKLDTLLENLKEIYDYIIIDSAPLGLVTDSMHLIEHADTSLIIVRENYSKKLFIPDLNNLIQKHNLTHIGLVVNAVRTSSFSYGYGYGYGHDDESSHR